MKPHIVVIGGGFGGLSAAQALGCAPAQVTLIDRENYHLFQPLLYQVATAGLSPADIAVPIRSILRREKNIEVMMADVQSIDSVRNAVVLKDRSILYDYLVVATGARHSYFGHESWEKLAPGLKSISDATTLRRNVLIAFEQAENERDPSKQSSYLTFVIIGAGPTGVELAGSIAELAHWTLRGDFRRIDPSSTRILLLEAGPRILPTFPRELSDRAAASLKRQGVEIRTGARVSEIQADGVLISNEKMISRTVIWAAGVQASPVGKWLGAETDRVGRVKVQSNLSLAGSPNVFVIGDAAYFEENGAPLPGLAAVAMQQGTYVGNLIRFKLQGVAPDGYPPFHYFDKGNLATIGRAFAVADLGFGKRRIYLSGKIAWLAWLVVHIYYLIGFRNRILVLLEWAWAYLTFRRGARLITMFLVGIFLKNLNCY